LLSTSSNSLEVYEQETYLLKVTCTKVPLSIIQLDTPSTTVTTSCTSTRNKSSSM